ncbi:MAG: transposase [Deltaproteobacteria bacterium]|nr:transposase [Deltaproteobacteria bacterium]
MPRIPRMVVDDETTVYHVMSRTALDGFVIGDIEKDFMLNLIKRYSALYFVEILGFCLMGNHFHILVKMFPEYKFTDEEIKKRYVGFYGDDRIFADGLIPALRAKLSSLSEFVREIKVGFARYYNKKHNRRGYFWGDRFKSVIVDKGETLVNCLAYIDLNPLRAGIVNRPEEYRWNSLGYHVQTNNRDNFLSTDFGLKEFNVKSKKERVTRYRRYVYEAGSVNQPVKGSAKVIEDKVLEKERSRAFELSKSDRFRYRTRYFTDSGIIGTKEFVSAKYQRFKHLFNSKHEKKPKAIKGLDGIYSLKRLSEVI